MKIFKYIVFISVLSSIFFVIYRESDKKGFRRWWISLKIAIMIAAIIAGFRTDPPQLPEPFVNNNQMYQERVLSDQEFNSFEDNDPKIILVKNSNEVEAFPVIPSRSTPRNSRNLNGLFGTKNNKPKDSSSNDNPDDDPNDPNSNSSSDFEINSNFKKNEAKSKTYEHQIYKKMSDKDLNSETDTDDESQCSNEEVKIGIAKDGSLVHIPPSQVRDKGLHIPDFLNKETLDGKFNAAEAKTLEYKDRLNYLRDKNNLPDDIVDQATDEILNFMTADDTLLIPGFIGADKIEGTVFINLRLNKVGFRDYNGYKFRTAMNMSNKKIEKIANTGFHLFPDAGNL